MSLVENLPQNEKIKVSLIIFSLVYQCWLSSKTKDLVRLEF